MEKVLIDCPHCGEGITKEAVLEKAAIKQFPKKTYGTYKHSKEFNTKRANAGYGKVPGGTQSAVGASPKKPKKQKF